MLDNKRISNILNLSISCYTPRNPSRFAKGSCDGEKKRESQFVSRCKKEQENMTRLASDFH